MLTKKLIEQCLDGIEYREGGEPIVLDFVVPFEGRTLVMVADWWTTEWGMGQGSFMVDAEPVETSPGHWDFDGLPGRRLAPASDEHVAEVMKNSRLRTDLGQTAYLRALSALHAESEGFDLAPWIEAIDARPPLDPQKILGEQTREREIGRIVLADPGGAVRDTLIFDEYGSAGVLDDDGFLAHLADEWVAYAEGERPSITEFMEKLRDTRFYGLTMTTAEVTTASGDVEAIAIRASLDTFRPEPNPS